MFRYILASTLILVCLDACWLTLASRLRVYPASAIAHVRPEFGLLAWTSLGCGVAFFCRGAATPLEAARRGFMIGLARQPAGCDGHGLGLLRGGVGCRAVSPCHGSVGVFGQLHVNGPAPYEDGVHVARAKLGDERRVGGELPALYPTQIGMCAAFLCRQPVR